MVRRCADGPAADVTATTALTTAQAVQTVTTIGGAAAAPYMPSSIDDWYWLYGVGLALGCKWLPTVLREAPAD